MSGSEFVAVHIYDCAQHGFANPVRGNVFDPPAAELAMTRTLDALRSV